MMFVRASRSPLKRSQMYSAISRRVERFYCSESNKPSQGEEKMGRNLKSQEEINVRAVAVERAKTRSVLAVSGPDAITFLNNLTTNELSQLQTDAACVHTFFLNARGRIIHDALIYKPDEEDTLFLECDISSLQALQTHLIMYRAKTNVEIRSVEREVGVWTVFDPLDIEAKASDDVDTSFLEDLDLGSNVLLSKDPRMPPLGFRILAPKDLDVGQILKTAGVGVAEVPSGSYRNLRFRLGIAEGHSEIGYGRSLPAEINGDYTNALCSTKTNYVGWSGVRFNGEVENRMMPLRFGTDARLVVNMPITDRRGKKRTPIGYLRGVQGLFGLALMHLQSVLNDRFCAVGKVEAECIKPPWWKEELSSAKQLREARQ